MTVHSVFAVAKDSFVDSRAGHTRATACIVRRNARMGVGCADPTDSIAPALVPSTPKPFRGMLSSIPIKLGIFHSFLG
jgi:hypothetical protein